MSQPLGNFVPRPAQTGDQFQARFAIGRPLLVQVVSVDGARSVKDQQTGQAVTKKAVVVNVWDLAGGQVSVTDAGAPVHGAPNTVYCNVMWMAGALVDNLEPYVGAPPMPLIINSVKGKNNFNYLTPVSIEGQVLQQVQQIYSADPGRIDREAAAKAQASAAQAAAPAYQQSGFQPMQFQPSAPAQQPLNGYTVPGPAQAPQPQYQQPMQPPAAAQFQAPPGQPGAIANIPAQVAQQWAPVDQAMQQAQQFDPNNNGQLGGWQPPQQSAPQAQQPPAQAPAQPSIGHVQNSDVANILAGLAQGQPQQ